MLRKASLRQTDGRTDGRRIFPKKNSQASACWVILCLHGGPQLLSAQGKPELALHDEASTSTQPSSPSSNSHFWLCDGGWSGSTQVGKQHKMTRWQSCIRSKGRKERKGSSMLILSTSRQKTLPWPLPLPPSIKFNITNSYATSNPRPSPHYRIFAWLGFLKSLPSDQGCTSHINMHFFVIFLGFLGDFYRTQVYLGSDLWVPVSQTNKSFVKLVMQAMQAMHRGEYFF